MKSKKLISLLCAGCIMVSICFRRLDSNSKAAATPVYTFDGSDITGFSGNGTLGTSE